MVLVKSHLDHPLWDLQHEFPEAAFFPIGYLFNNDLVLKMARTKKFMNVHHLEAKWSNDFFRVDNELRGFLFFSSYLFNSSRKPLHIS